MDIVGVTIKVRSNLTFLPIAIAAIHGHVSEFVINAVMLKIFIC